MACPQPPWLRFRAMWISVGVFDSADLVQVFQTGEYEDGIADNSSYEEGHWNGDGDFDSSDLVAMFQSSHYEAQINRRVERAASVRPTWDLDSALAVRRLRTKTSAWETSGRTRLPTIW